MLFRQLYGRLAANKNLGINSRISDIQDYLYEIKVGYKKVKSKLKRRANYPFFEAAVIVNNQPTSNTSLDGNRDREDYSFDRIPVAIEDVCELYPKRVKILFKNINLEKPGLELVKQAVLDNNLDAACRGLIDYYHQRPIQSWLGNYSIKWLENSNCSNNILTSRDADEIINDIYTFQTVKSQVPRFKNGFLNWSYSGIKNDREWAWFLNRHYHIKELFSSYKQTGKLEYIHYLNNNIIDWIISSNSEQKHIRSQWRGLEVAWRVYHWSYIFYGLQDVPEFSDACRILMLSSIVEHAYFLRHMHTWGANWLVKEMKSLALIACCWSEFKDANKWLDYACKHLEAEIIQQVYPDGAHKELTSHYHRATLDDFQDFADLLVAMGKPVPDRFHSYLENMWNYLAYSISSNGMSLLNNDSDLDDNREALISASKIYHRPDWIYILNHGQEPAENPTKSFAEIAKKPSIFFPWAGQLVMRSGWEESSHWGFFDMGALGINYHVHHDKLHLSISAYGRDLLVDSGRYSYVRNKYWQYFRESAGHNVILVDRQGQKNDRKQSYQSLIDRCVITEEFDFAQQTFDRGYINIKGKATHTRAVLYLRNKYWVVVDRIFTNRPRTIEALWHFHPDCTVVMSGESVGSIDKDVGNLQIIPAANFPWDVTVVRGQASPMQGWWSREYNHKTPNSTAIYQTEIAGNATFAWVLFPSLGVPTNVTVNVISSSGETILIDVKIPGENDTRIAVRLSGNGEMKLNDELSFKGSCAIIRGVEKALVSNGCICDVKGEIVTSDSFCQEK
ncbi:alginate lyase family protein [Calothrix sp. PCC 6303]|uniref:alginate lyase family protein n=1 Tax=Calothrix sp. PCC 6303 TaxID=1170562 RepID=UPI0002A03958|nr:alginate lyase family protein [Calothrix sp. PCC 6303]AFZ01181.1 Heparinase II/III family protein [Calothrix sp. PCC 6303]